MASETSSENERLEKESNELCLKFLSQDFDFDSDSDFKIKAGAVQRPYGARVVIQLHHLGEMRIQTLVRIGSTTDLQILQETLDTLVDLFRRVSETTKQATPTFTQMFSGGSTLCVDDE